MEEVDMQMRHCITLPEMDLLLMNVKVNQIVGCSLFLTTVAEAGTLR